MGDRNIGVAGLGEKMAETRGNYAWTLTGCVERTRLAGVFSLARATHWGYRASALAKKATFVREPYVSYPHRLIFWFFCNVISPHKQGSFDFSRARLAFFHRGMATISGFTEQSRKMDAVRLGDPFGLSVHCEK
jgi:hypothetical protein